MRLGGSLRLGAKLPFKEPVSRKVAKTRQDAKTIPDAPCSNFGSDHLPDTEFGTNLGAEDLNYEER